MRKKNFLLIILVAFADQVWAGPSDSLLVARTPMTVAPLPTLVAKELAVTPLTNLKKVIAEEAFERRLTSEEKKYLKFFSLVINEARAQEKDSFALSIIHRLVPMNNMKSLVHSPPYEAIGVVFTDKVKNTIFASESFEVLMGVCLNNAGNAVYILISPALIERGDNIVKNAQRLRKEVVHIIDFFEGRLRPGLSLSEKRDLEAEAFKKTMSGDSDEILTLRRYEEIKQK